MPDLEDRLRRLRLDPPGDLRARAVRASEEPSRPPARRGQWLQVAGALVVVALVVVMALTVTGHPDPRVFSNISAGLGT
jgi:ferric-dicitrate binding protein FerR (iron transport regulator)